MIPVPKDQERDSRIYTILVNSGIISKKTAMKKIMGYDDKMAESEMKLLEDELKINSAIE